jgi:hypothetical protein
VALIYCYLVGGGKITRPLEKKKRGPGRPQIFGKDTKSASYSRDVTRFYSGHDFTQSGPRWTSRPVRDDSAAKRDAQRKAGVSSDDFAGAVVEAGGKLGSKRALHAVDRAPIDLVSDRTMAESAKRDGGRRARQVVKLIEDTADDLRDASNNASIRDDMNLNAVDHEHLDRFRLAA